MKLDRTGTETFRYITFIFFKSPLFFQKSDASCYASGSMISYGAYKMYFLTLSFLDHYQIV